MSPAAGLALTLGILYLRGLSPRVSAIGVKVWGKGLIIQRESHFVVYHSTTRHAHNVTAADPYARRLLRPVAEVMRYQALLNLFEVRVDYYKGQRFKALST